MKVHRIDVTYFQRLKAAYIAVEGWTLVQHAIAQTGYNLFEQLKPQPLKPHLQGYGNPYTQDLMWLHMFEQDYWEDYNRDAILNWFRPDEPVYEQHLVPAHLLDDLPF